MLKGIDVSKHQGVIEWEKVGKSGVDFSIIRAGYGVSTVDQYFKANIEGALKNSIAVGVYWFLYANNEEEAIKNALMFDKAISAYKDKITFKVWCDYEYDTDRYARQCGYNPTKATRTAIVKAFCEKMRSLGYEVGVYANPDYLNNYFNDLSMYPLWLAQYATKKSRDCEIWQYTSKGKVDGIKGNVDMNYYYGAAKSVLPNLKGYNGFSIVQALKTYGYESSFAYRKKLWQQLGKTTIYRGTAEQNKELIKLLGGTVDSLPSLKGYKGVSIVAALKQFGYESSFEYRKKLWAKIGKTETYKGTALQNITLLNYLRK